MFCPNCGQKNSETQKFCRACGMNLEQTSIALAEQFPGKAGSEIEREEQRLELFGKVAFGGFGIVIGVAIIGLLYAIIRNSIIAGDQPLVGVILALIVIFAALTLAWVVLREDLKNKRKKLMERMGVAASPLEPETSKLLNNPAETTIGSIIEDTTDLLPVEDRTRKL